MYVTLFLCGYLEDQSICVDFERKAKILKLKKVHVFSLKDNGIIK